MSVLDLILTIAAVPVLLPCLYLGGLALLSWRQRAQAAPPSALRFDIVVPAHNEQDEIAATVTSLKAVAYPASQFRVIVVADNCSDETAARAAAAGALVLPRQDSTNRGKGYALAHAFRHSLAEGFADAVVVVDADTLVSPNLLSEFAARLDQGEAVLQADYGVRNPLSSWRTRLMTIALGAFHGVRSVARERLGLSCGLRGNGMAFTNAVLKAHPPQAFSIVEDLEYGIQLGYAGIRVGYVHDATVRGHMAVSEGASRTQRRRWERGRAALVRLHAGALLREGLRRRSAILLDLALDLVVPPLGILTLAVAVGLVASLAAIPLGAAVAPWIWSLSLGAILLHVLRGWALSNAGIVGLLYLLCAPAYVAWKLTLRFRDKGKAPQEWVRTSREVRL